MDAKKYWDMIYNALSKRGLSVTEFAQAIGYKRETIYTQRRKNIIPCGEQVLAMQEYLGLVITHDKENPMEEYLPYLEKADPITLSNIRKLLDMPAEENGDTFRLPSHIKVG